MKKWLVLVLFCVVAILPRIASSATFDPSRQWMTMKTPHFFIRYAIESEELAKMRQAVKRVIRPRKDRVRYYHLCQQCLTKTEVTSGPEVLHETDVIVV